MLTFLFWSHSHDLDFISKLQRRGRAEASDKTSYWYRVLYFYTYSHVENKWSKCKRLQREEVKIWQRSHTVSNAKISAKWRTLSRLPWKMASLPCRDLALFVGRNWHVSCPAKRNHKIDHKTIRAIASACGNGGCTTVKQLRIPRSGDGLCRPLSTVGPIVLSETPLTYRIFFLNIWQKKTKSWYHQL